MEKKSAPDVVHHLEQTASAFATLGESAAAATLKINAAWRVAHDAMHTHFLRMALKGQRP